MMTFLLLTGLVLVLAAAPALGAKGGNKGNEVTGSIALHSDAARLSDAAAGPSYGSEVSFDTEVSGTMAPKSDVYVTVVCVQNDTVVFQYSGGVDAAYPLADQAGQGLEWDGGDADCSATLIYSVRKGKSFDLTWLDVEEFHVVGDYS
jgi:hypothetical protein